jgi:hypothetical protein
MKTKITVSDRLRVLAIVQHAMDSYEATGKMENETDGVKALFDKMYQGFNDKQDAILQPKPTQPRKPRTKHTATPAEHGITGGSEPIARYEPSGDYVNPNAKRGRYGKGSA